MLGFKTALLTHLTINSLWSIIQVPMPPYPRLALLQRPQPNWNPRLSGSGNRCNPTTPPTGGLTIKPPSTIIYLLPTKDIHDT